jgi:hypothetical protein
VTQYNLHQGPVPGRGPAVEKHWFKQPEILPLPWRNILSLMDFIINNQEILQTNSSVHNINTRNKRHIHRPNAKLSYFQKRTFYFGINIFIDLLSSVTVLKNEKTKRIN